MDVRTLMYLFADYKMDIKLPKDIPKCRDKFMMESYMRWAADELFMFILRNKDQPPRTSAIKFLKMVDDFSKRTKKDKNIWIAARLIAKDMADILNAMFDDEEIVKEESIC